MIKIDSVELLKMMKSMVEYPFGQICVHNVALNLYSLCEKAGMEMPEELAKSLVDASLGDEENVRILDEMIKHEKV